MKEQSMALRNNYFAWLAGPVLLGRLSDIWASMDDRTVWVERIMAAVPNATKPRVCCLKYCVCPATQEVNFRSFALIPSLLAAICSGKFVQKMLQFCKKNCFMRIVSFNKKKSNLGRNLAVFGIENLCRSLQKDLENSIIKCRFFHRNALPQK